MTSQEDPQVLQKKLYFLLEQLQNMARDLPPYALTRLWQSINIILYFF